MQRKYAFTLSYLRGMNRTNRILVLMLSATATWIMSGCSEAPKPTAPAPTPTAADMAKAGEALYTATCMACHGPKAEGIKAMNAPALAGQEEWYVARQLRQFQSGVRGADPAHLPGTQMAAIAKTVRSADIFALAAYAASLPTVAHTPEVNGDVSAGKARFDAVCTACHGQTANGNKTLNAPKLTTLNDWYIVSQLGQYVHGARGTVAQDTFGLQMRPMATSLESPKAINDVASYIASLQTVQ